jgi:hypothetical protein
MLQKSRELGAGPSAHLERMVQFSGRIRGNVGALDAPLHRWPAEWRPLLRGALVNGHRPLDFSGGKNGRERRNSRAHGGPCSGGEMLVCLRPRIHGSAPRVDETVPTNTYQTRHLVWPLPLPLLRPPKNCSPSSPELREGKNTDQILPPKKGGKKIFNCACVSPPLHSHPVPHETQRSQVRILSVFTVLLNKFSTFPSRDGDYSLVRRQQLTETGICIIFSHVLVRCVIVEDRVELLNLLGKSCSVILWLHVDSIIEFSVVNLAISATSTTA